MPSSGASFTPQSSQPVNCKTHRAWVRALKRAQGGLNLLLWENPPIGFVQPSHVLTHDFAHRPQFDTHTETRR